MIDLRSDTITTPSQELREAAMTAPVGDDVYEEDPTVNDLEARCAELLGTDDALYCPTGTMANQIAVDVWTNPGEELILEYHSHIYKYELGGAARHSGLQIRPIDASPSGALAPADIEAAYVETDLHRAGTGLVTLENTHNMLGGRAIEVDAIADAAAAAHQLDVPVHLDGARLWNAAVAHEVDVATFVEPVDSAMLCFSKGLGAPVGSILVGSASFIEQARRSRKSFGGGMRQAGIIAAPALKSLEHIADLKEDHRRAAWLAAALDDLEGLSVTSPETNIIMVEIDPAVTDAGTWLAHGEKAGVQGVQVNPQRVRYVTHRDLTDEDIEIAIDRLSTLREQFR